MNDMKITKKHIYIRLDFNDVEHIVHIPFIGYEHFKECHLIFAYVYEMLANNDINPLTFSTDLDAYIELAIDTKYKGINKDAKLKAFKNFVEKSFVGAYVLDASNNYEAVSFDNFVIKNKAHEDAIQSFIDDARGFYVFFYAIARYLKQKTETIFTDSYTSLDYMELKDYFMRYSLANNSTQQQTQTATISDTQIAQETQSIAPLATRGFMKLQTS